MWPFLLHRLCLIITHLPHPPSPSDPSTLPCLFHPFPFPSTPPLPFPAQVDERRLKKFEKEYQSLLEAKALAESPQERLKEENSRLQEAVGRLEHENECLAQELVASKINLREEMDKVGQEKCVCVCAYVCVGCAMTQRVTVPPPPPATTAAFHCTPTPPPLYTVTHAICVYH